jgi:hypothetical protein
MLSSVVRPAKSIERARKRAMGKRIDRRKLDELAELRLCFAPPSDSEIGNAERLPDRGLVRLAPLRLLERDRGLARPC